jgi:hypothetical protein
MEEFVKSSVEIQYTMYYYAVISITILTLLAYSTSFRLQFLLKNLVLFEYLFKSD